MKMYVSPFRFQVRVYHDPALQEKWDRITLRRLVRERLGMAWRDFLKLPDDQTEPRQP